MESKLKNIILISFLLVVLLGIYITFYYLISSIEFIPQEIMYVISFVFGMLVMIIFVYLTTNLSINEVDQSIINTNSPKIQGEENIFYSDENIHWKSKVSIFSDKKSLLSDEKYKNDQLEW